MQSTYRYVFGPVVSRRLGRSLGVDIVPRKICTMDCVYCEVGLTTLLTTDRREYTPVEDVIAEVKRRLSDAIEIDYVTITASGEPTLHSGLGRIIAGIRKLTAAPIAVLTNGSLLGLPQVQQELMGADLVVPSFDAPTDEQLQSVNRPAPGITVNTLLDGLRSFCGVYHGRVWLEVLLVAGMTDSEESVKKLAQQFKGLGVERVQLNTVVRPPAIASAGPVSFHRLQQLALLFEPPAELAIAAPAQLRNSTTIAVARSDVLDLLKRRPCPLSEIAEGLGIEIKIAEQHVVALESVGLVHHTTRSGRAYYQAL